MATEDYFKDLKKLKYAEEHELVSELISKNDWINNPDISQNASLIVENCRKDRNKTRLDSFFLEYGLSNQEGVALMCLAESLLRIPDNQTCDEIIEEKIGGKKWLDHFNKSPSLFVNATTFGLFLAEQVVELDKSISVNPISWFQGLTSRIGDPVLREAIKKGYLVAIISGGKSQGLIERFKHLKINDVYLACDDKKDALSDLMHIHELDSQSILYMGDDINDWEVMKEVGLSSCPQDAIPEIKAIADYISHKNGGQGCVRDVIEQTLKVQGKWSN